MQASGRPRILIFVIAYRAETTLERVLDRIPSALFDSYECEVLVVDDASTDRTFTIGRTWQTAHPERTVTVLRNEYNQGYGGNQKVGYRYAIKERFDHVAMVHGDGQYAPEELPRLLEPLLKDEADVVLGSRMLEAGQARKGGMPLYKWLGNRVLTTMQNALLGCRLSEFHSGYRIYRVAALARLPFTLNTNDFHFDSEILIQFLNAGLRIVELPIPTYYGDEICYVNGLKYAGDVTRVTLQNVAHRKGILYQRRFDVGPGDNSHYSLKLGYPSSHSMAIDAVPAHTSVIDLGAGPGGVAKALAEKGCQVAVVDQHPISGDGEEMDVFLQDLDDPPVFDAKPYQHILLLDMIEHLRNPELFLQRLRRQFTHEKKTVIITTPNIAFLPERLMLLAGQFNYGKMGILDVTHTRLFTFRSLRRLLRDHGFRIKTMRGVPAPFPRAFGDGPLSRAALTVNQALIVLSKTLFAYQIYVEAETTPDADFVLETSKAASQETQP
jgi:glycosyltransferase involved in cell wall biosynthesis/2-polyprenyl-3-methyl-5-hydroxy-6-metoxy-1,4-benzoquinol methylase